MSRLEEVKAISKQRAMTSGGKNNLPYYVLGFEVFKMSETEH
jgi:hypothetical protein